MGILQSVLGSLLGGGGVLENFLLQRGGVAGSVVKGINYMDAQGMQQQSSGDQMNTDLTSPTPVGSVEGTDFMDLLLKLKYPYLFNNSGVR